MPEGIIGPRQAGFQPMGGSGNAQKPWGWEVGPTEHPDSTVSFLSS